MLKLQLVAVFLIAGTLVSPAWQGSTPTTTAGGLKSRPIVTATEAPSGTEDLPVKWVRVAVPDLGVMRAAVARPSGTGPFPAVLVLHGTHGFARQYVEWANDLARGGFIAVAACWFSGGGGAGANEVTPIPCPEIPPLGPGEYPTAVQFVDALAQATRALPGARADRLALVGHSRGAGATQQYLLASGNVQAAVLHSSGYALRPWTRAAELNLPILIMHGTADSFGENTQFRFAREFEMALRANKRPVQTAYCEGCGHSTFFTNSTQRDDELKRMIEFLRSHLGK
jgi:dienelactone hydrolase